MSKQRMIKTLEKMVDNGGIVRPAMREAGYAEAYSKNPQKLERTKAWPDLVKKYFPDTKLAKKHEQLLNAESETVQLGALKLGYEVTNKIQPDLPQTVNTQVNLNFFSNPAIMAKAKELDELIKNQIINGDETKKPN